MFTFIDEKEGKGQCLHCKYQLEQSYSVCMCIYKYIFRGKKIIWFLQSRKCGQEIYGHILQCLSNAERDLQYSDVIQEPEVFLNQWIKRLDHV